MLRRLSWTSTLIILLCCFGRRSPAAEANPVNFWTKLGPSLPAGTNLLAFAHGKFYSSSSDNGLYKSDDGVSWTRDLAVADFWKFPYSLFKEVNGDLFAQLNSTADGCWLRRDGSMLRVPNVSTNRMMDMAYQNGIYVMGTVRDVLRSTNGLQWTPVFPLGCVSICNGNGKFIGILGNTTLQSADGITWQTNAAPTTNQLNSIAFGNGTFVAVGTRGTILSSPNGTDWTHRGIQTNVSFLKVIFAKNTFIAGGNNLLSESSDGVQWVSQMPLFKFPTGYVRLSFSYISYGNGTVLVSGERAMLRRRDGQDWDVFVPKISIGDIRAMAHWKGTYIFASAGLNTGADPSAPTNWINRGYSVRSFAYNDERIVGACNGTGSRHIYSTNGVDWKEAMFNSRQNGVIWDGARFLSVGVGGEVHTSTNGETWAVKPSASSVELQAIVYGDAKYVAAGNEGVVQWSVDGGAWALGESGETTAITGLGYASGLFVGTGTNGLIITSSDGEHWMRRQSGTTQDLSAPVFGHGRWVVVGHQLRPVENYMAPTDSIVLSSIDGTTWERSLEKPEQPLFTVMVTADGFLVAGASGGIFQSGVHGPPMFKQIAIGAGGERELHVRGELGKTQRLEWQEMLDEQNWPNSISYVQTNELQVIRDPGSSGDSRFYRIVSP
jgi:hypothetical protein